MTRISYILIRWCFTLWTRPTRQVRRV